MEKLYYLFIHDRKIQNEMDTENEELNQYYLSYEFKETIDKHLLNEEQNNCCKQIVSKQSYSNRDTFLMEYNTELNMTLIDCINHHQIITKFCELIEDFFSSFVLVKSIQLTLQICNLAFTATMVNKRSLVLQFTCMRVLIVVFFLHIYRQLDH